MVDAKPMTSSFINKNEGNPSDSSDARLFLISSIDEVFLFIFLLIHRHLFW